jgi:hypothetical protein
MANEPFRIYLPGQVWHKFNIPVRIYGNFTIERAS